MTRSLDYRKITRIAAAVLIALEMALFPMIHLGRDGADVVGCYLAIVLVALFALVTLWGERDGHIIRLGIGFTLVADYFLVIAANSELEGVISFIAVQACYFAYTLVRETRTKVRYVNIASRIFIVVGLTITAFLVLGEDTDALAIASVIYYGNLVANAVFAFLLGKRDRIFAIGLVLFGMCDIWIGLEVLFSSYLDSNLMDFVYNANCNLPWVFYQPSQTLIALNLLGKVNRE